MNTYHTNKITPAKKQKMLKTKYRIAVLISCVVSIVFVFNCISAMHVEPVGYSYGFAEFVNCVFQVSF